MWHNVEKHIRQSGCTHTVAEPAISQRRSGKVSLTSLDLRMNYVIVSQLSTDLGERSTGLVLSYSNAVCRCVNYSGDFPLITPSRPTSTLTLHEFKPATNDKNHSFNNHSLCRSYNREIYPWDTWIVDLIPENNGCHSGKLDVIGPWQPQRQMMPYQYTVITQDKEKSKNSIILFKNEQTKYMQSTDAERNSGKNHFQVHSFLQL